MDYRNRCYFLVRLNPYSFWYDEIHDDFGVIYTSALELLQKKIKSLKISAPYNHFVENNNIGGYDGNIPTVGYVQMMLSCNLIEKEILLSCLYELKETSLMSIKYIELTKELCGQ